MQSCLFLHAHPPPCSDPLPCSLLGQILCTCKWNMDGFCGKKNWNLQNLPSISSMPQLSPSSSSAVILIRSGPASNRLSMLACWTPGIVKPTKQVIINSFPLSCCLLSWDPLPQSAQENDRLPIYSQQTTGSGEGSSHAYGLLILRFSKVERTPSHHYTQSHTYRVTNRNK